jgi:hypothetical protein
VKRVHLLGLAAALLSGCATWRPEAESRYYCVNTDIYFTVHYSWRPTPSALLQLDDGEPVELVLTGATPGSAAGHYTYESGYGVRLGVTPDYALLDRPGERRLSCAKQAPIIV